MLKSGGTRALDEAGPRSLSSQRARLLRSRRVGPAQRGSSLDTYLAQLAAFSSYNRMSTQQRFEAETY